MSYPYQHGLKKLRHVFVLNFLNQHTKTCLKIFFFFFFFKSSITILLFIFIYLCRSRNFDVYGATNRLAGAFLHTLAKKYKSLLCLSLSNLLRALILLTLTKLIKPGFFFLTLYRSFRACNKLWISSINLRQAFVLSFSKLMTTLCLKLK